MIRVRVYCESKSPYLMNPMTKEKIEDIRIGKNVPRVKDRTTEAEARDKLFRVDGRIGFPSDNLYACLVRAGTRTPYKGKANITRSDGSSVLASLLEIEEEFLPLVYKGEVDWDSEAGWVVDVRAGWDQRGTARVPIVRPKFPHWGFEATLRIHDPLSEETAKRLINEAGDNWGLGDFRPGKSGGRFGRFAVKEWTRLNSS